MNKQIIRCITCAILCVVLVMLAGCSDESKAKKAEGSSGAQQAYASEASSAGEIFVCSSLFGGQLTRNFKKYTAVIWVEPVTQEVFLVYPGTGYNGAWREVVGPLKVAHDDTHFIDTDVYPISFDAYKKEAEEQGYTFVYEE